MGTTCTRRNSLLDLATTSRPERYEHEQDLTQDLGLPKMWSLCRPPSLGQPKLMKTSREAGLGLTKLSEY